MQDQFVSHFITSLKLDCSWHQIVNLKLHMALTSMNMNMNMYYLFHNNEHNTRAPFQHDAFQSILNTCFTTMLYNFLHLKSSNV